MKMQHVSHVLQVGTVKRHITLKHESHTKIQSIFWWIFMHMCIPAKTRDTSCAFFFRVIYSFKTLTHTHHANYS